jgi:hypothetical protein
MSEHPRGRLCRRRASISLDGGWQSEQRIWFRYQLFSKGESKMRSHNSALKLVAMGIVISASISQLQAQQETVPAQVGPTQFLQPANTDQLRHSQVLGIPTSHCGHVIDLLMTNRMRQQTGYAGHGEVHLPHLTVGLKPGDLELLCVHLVCEGDAHKGPIFQIGMRNNSCVPIGNFKVSVVGVLCQIQVHSPTATVCIPRMEAGEETQIQVQLPLTCMAMGPVAQPVAFDTLIVALDSYDELLECDELNNVQILNRAEIGPLVAEVPVPDTTQPVDPAPAVPAPEVPQDGDTSPLDGLDLDNLDLNQAQNLLSRSR